MSDFETALEQLRQENARIPMRAIFYHTSEDWNGTKTYIPYQPEGLSQAEFRYIWSQMEFNLRDMDRMIEDKDGST